MPHLHHHFDALLGLLLAWSANLLHIWSMSIVEIALTAHVVMPAGHPGDGFLAQVCRELCEQFGIQHATLQIEVGDSESPGLLEPQCSQ